MLKFIDGLKTYFGITVTFIAALLAAFNPDLIADAVGATEQLRAIINVAFIFLGTIIATFGRIDAQRKINKVRSDG